jgi:dTDP-4-dehydrorhamnose 3,5-epimerase
MKITKFFIDGLLLIEPDVYKDDRGYFLESYNTKKYQEIGINEIFVQDNEAQSKFGILRGLHFQKGKFAQGKLVRVVRGRVLDVAVDIRKNSTTFGKYVALELSSENKLQFWIPPGFAHGYAVLSDISIFQYKCTQLYSKENEGGILYNDPHLGINWKISNPILSEKDKKLPLLSSLQI